MHLAAESNQIHIVKILMIHRANINARMEGDLTPLTLAKTNEAEDVVRLLMQKGAIE
jgi:ankyrin repeat protein